MSTGKKRPAPVLAPFDPRLRYSIGEAAGYLRQSVSQTYKDLREGSLSPIIEGGRTFVPGVEIERRCRPTAPVTATQSIATQAN